MSRSLIVTGRGGTGKSTFSVLCSRFLPAPKLLVDADPDQCLAHMLGVDLDQEEINTVSQALYEIQDGQVSREIKSLPLAQKVEYLLHLSCLYESQEFDLLTLGVKWTRGCYCAPNDILRTLVTELVGNYKCTIFDSPAGLEHLNRRVVEKAGDIFAVLDPSAKSLRNAETVRDFADTIGLRFDNLYLVANHRFPPEMVDRVREMPGATYLGRIQEDPTVRESDWQGRSLLELPPESPACASVRAILERAGYDVSAG